jgi:chromate reductase, NAD(P)H dehydrogenase (quinone)
VTATTSRGLETSDDLRILGIPGSLRRHSFNKALLNAAQELAPAGVRMEIFELEGIPLFNEDEEAKFPERVRQFKAAVKRADAVLFATPEYSKSVPGVLKNALDWAERPDGVNVFDAKPAGIMSASVGTLGGVRAQYHLRQVLVDLNMHPINRPEVFVGLAEQKFDPAGRLVDESTRKRVRLLLESLVEWTRKLKRSEELEGRMTVA